MDGLITIVDPPHFQTIETIYSDLNERFQLFDSAIPFNPHFSYHVAESYENAHIPDLMDEIARKTAVFTIKANGLGIFPAPEPILYIPVTRTIQLNLFHEKIWTTFNPIAHESVAYYHPDNWFPHITIGTSGIPKDKLGPVVSWLLNQELFFEIEATNLTFFREVATGYKQAHQFSLKR